MPNTTDPGRRKVSDAGGTEYDIDSAHGSDERTRERARENADGTLARLRKRLRSALRRD